jgi:hypothetical protein
VPVFQPTAVPTNPGESVICHFASDAPEAAQLYGGNAGDWISTDTGSDSIIDTWAYSGNPMQINAEGCVTDVTLANPNANGSTCDVTGGVATVTKAVIHREDATQANLDAARRAHC